MPKVSGAVVLYFDGIEFEDDGEVTLQDLAYDALRSEVFGSDGDVVDVQIDSIDE